MKTIIFSFFTALLFVQYSFSQDYTSIKPNYTSYYGNYHFAIKLDSITYSADTTFYHNFKRITTNGTGNYKLGDSWTGKDIIILNNGYNLFINRDSDTIFINTLANINEKWRFYTFPDNRYIEAEVTSIGEEVFIGITDDVKTINLQLKDASGNNISDPINNMYLKLSKHYGLSRLFNFDMFPQYLIEMDITGFFIFGFQNFGAFDIFDYAVGDELHINYNHFLFQEYDVEKWTVNKIVEKEWSNNGNTLTYTIDYCFREDYEGSINTGQGTRTEIIDITNPEYGRLNNSNAQPFYEFDGNIHRFHLVKINGDEKRLYKIYSGSDINDLHLSYIEHPDYFHRRYYLKGLGGEYWEHLSSICCLEWNKLVYYKKGTTEWGNPYSCSWLLETESIANTKNFKIFPNPSDDNLNISINKDLYMDTFTIRITDISGKTYLNEIKTTNEFRIDTSHLSGGLYIIQLISEKGISTKKFMIRHQ